MHVQLTHDFEATPQEFWNVFFDEPYNVELWHRLKAKQRIVYDWKEDGKTIYRSIKVLPERDLPEVVKKVLKGDLGYTENSTFFWDKNSMDVLVIPTLMADRTDIKGRYFLEVLAPGKLRRTFDCQLTVKFPMFGGRIEKAIYEDMAKSYDVAALVTKEWLEKRKKEGTSLTPHVPPKL